MIKNIAEAIDRIADITEELLVGVNEDKSKSKIYEPIDIENCLSNVIIESSLLAMQHKIHIKVIKKDDLIPLIKGVLFEVRFVLHSLITNALNYSPIGDTVTITLKQDGAFAKIVVHNNGIPIKESEKAMLFSQFGRGEQAIRINPNGSGLGLYLTKEIMIKHEGTVSFESDGKDGTSFIIRFPLSDKGELETSLR